MSPPLIAAIPIKPFGVAKARLGPAVSAETRSRLGRAVAARTASLAAAAGAEVVIVVADDGVASWAKAQDFGVIREDPDLGSGLDGAASTAARHADLLGLSWAVIHADLPVVTAGDLQWVFELATSGPVIAPSHNGGTNIISGSGASFPFSYGAGSFHRHLAAMPAAAVLATPRLSLDLDTPGDLAVAQSSRSGAWLAEVLSGSRSDG